MSEIKLKPCPFCNGKVIMTKVIEDKFYVRALIYCPLCSVEMKSRRIRRGVRGVTKELIDESNRIARWWNRRADNACTSNNLQR